MGERDRRLDPLQAAALEVQGGEEGRSPASGWIALHTSCTNPGRVSSAERIPPPTVGAASKRATDRFALASVMAAASPLGPLPTTTASYRSALIGSRVEGCVQGHGRRVVPSQLPHPPGARRVAARSTSCNGSGTGAPGRSPAAGPGRGWCAAGSAGPDRFEQTLEEARGTTPRRMRGESGRNHISQSSRRWYGANCGGRRRGSPGLPLNSYSRQSASARSSRRVGALDDDLVPRPA